MAKKNRPAAAGQRDTKKGGVRGEASGLTAHAVPVLDVNSGRDYAVYWPNGLKSHVNGVAVRKRFAFYAENAVKIVALDESGDVLFDRSAA